MPRCQKTNQQLFIDSPNRPIPLRLPSVDTRLEQFRPFSERRAANFFSAMSGKSGKVLVKGVGTTGRHQASQQKPMEAGDGMMAHSIEHSRLLYLL